VTPAVAAVKKAGINHRLHEYQASNPGSGGKATPWGLEAATLLGIEPERVFKTLIVQVDRKLLVVGIVPVACELNLKALAAAANGKKAELADRKLAERSTGYVLGGISPLGQRQKLLTLLDSSAQRFETLYISGGRRGLEIELSATDLLSLSHGRSVELAR